MTKPRASRRHAVILNADPLALIVANNRARMGLTAVVQLGDRLLSRTRRNPRRA